LATDHEQDFSLNKIYLRLTPEEEVSLSQLQPVVAAHTDELVSAFYRHLLQFDETRRLLSDELITTRLLAAQRRYLLELVGGQYGPDYQAGRLKIGQVHERIGLKPQWYLGAYALYLNLLRPLIVEEFRQRPAQVPGIWTALTKVVFLDIQLAIEAYVEKSSEKLEYANRQLAELSRELEKGLNKKKLDLAHTQEQLRQTERLAELGTLASGMAHEIGTPMNIILGRAEYLMRRTQEESTRKGLETIVSQVERITKIMTQLLTFARQRPSEPRPLDLRGIIEDSLEVLQDRLAWHHITVERDFEEGIPAVRADADHMSQVLLNLMINSIHAMPDGGTLCIGLKHGAGEVILTVMDTGHGIPQEHLSRIFDPFFTTKEVGKGTGLGLTVVHGIIQEHGGSIDVESQPGRGTTFTLTFPVSPS
jgi:signal transduction histidine kinase